MAVDHRRARGDQARSTATSAAPRSSTTTARSTSRTDRATRRWSSPSPTAATSSATRRRCTSAQRRGGRGITGAATHEEDFVAQLFVASTHDTLLMFTDKGRAYSKKVWEVPQAGAHRQGQGVRQPAPAAGGRARRRDAAGARVLRGRVRGHGDAARHDQEDLAGRVRATSAARGIIALDDRRRRRPGRACASPRARRHPARHAQRLGDPLPRGERPPDGPHRARRARHPPARGRATRSSAWRVIPRDEPATLLTVCERGYGKRTPLADYPTKNRGGKGVITIKTTERNGKVVSAAPRHRRRRPDAHHRRRQADPHAGRRHPDHRPQHAGRAPDPPRRAARRSSRSSASPRRKRARPRSRPRWPPRAPSSRPSRWPRRIWATRPRRRRRGDGGRGRGRRRGRRRRPDGGKDD